MDQFLENTYMRVCMHYLPRRPGHRSLTFAHARSSVALCACAVARTERYFESTHKHSSIVYFQPYIYIHWSIPHKHITFTIEYHT